MYRVIIIGAGIVGLSIARVLSRFENLKITVIDKNPDVGWGVSKANTSIIHPCHEEDPDKHPLRTKLCLEGHNIWYKWVRELDIPNRWPGEIIVATNEDEYHVLKHYLELARRNNVPGVRIVDGEELFKLEPSINRSSIAGLYAPSAGSIDPVQACIALAENNVDNGVRFVLGEKVVDIVVKDKHVKEVVTSNNVYEADIVINAAGLFADEIARMVGINDYIIYPRRGQYILFDKTASPKPDKIIHTTPTPKTKGVYVLKTIEETLLIGPTAEDLSIEEKEANIVTKEGISFILENAKKIIEKLPPMNLVIRTFTGIRPEPPNGSYILRFHEEPWGFVEAAGIRSPGLTAAPAIAYYIKNLISQHIDLKLKKKWIHIRKGIIKIKNLSRIERNNLIKQNPKYGRIICQCMGVSEAEILEAINRMRKIGVKEITLDGIKFRTHSMYGRCQGTFCRPLISLIVSRETGLEPWKVSFKGGNSTYGIGFVKELFMKR